MAILLTGAAGFIGFHLTQRLIKEGHEIIGLDNINDYYDVTLKYDRLKQLEGEKNFTFIKCTLEDRPAMEKVFKEQEFSTVIHLAAQAGVRYSLENPHAYVDSNIVGFINILEGCRHKKVDHLIYASSSSVYGGNTQKPFSVRHNVDHPLSLYAASKKANELMAHTYSHLYGLPTTGLRFFTVYGPWGRPDMALFIFTKAILNGETIKVFNNGKMKRDFTYIKDIVEGITRLLDKKPEPKPAGEDYNPEPGSSTAPYKIYNIGNNKPEELMDFISVLEKALGREAKKEFLPLQPGDVGETYADVDELIRDVGFRPDTTIEEGIGHFVDWYKRYCGGDYPAA